MNFPSQKKLSICIVGEELATGGAERCASQLSVFFEKNNCTVYHVISIDNVEYEYAGQLFNLGTTLIKKRFFHRFKRFWLMCRFFKDHSFDYIIDLRTKRYYVQEFIIARFIYNAPLIIWVHSYMTHLYFPKGKWLTKLMYSDSLIISVSNTITEKIKNLYGLTNLETISNPLDIDFIKQKSMEVCDIESHYVLAAGSMWHNFKQFDVLIDCYSKSLLPSQNIKLVILGDGILKKNFEIQAKKLGIEELVQFKGSVANPFKYYKNALYTVLSSKNEGFPMVLIESLACGTPVVSYDCLSGPNEIITTNVNGLLVENQNEQALTNAMNLMITNTDLYDYCKSNAQKSILKFSIEAIGNQWLSVLK